MNGMKMIGMAALVLILAGCNDTKTVYITAPDTQAPAAPRGVTSTTGDGQVWVDWYPNGENDLAGYKVWRVSEAVLNYGGNFVRIATVGPATTTFVDQNVTNGVTYFYAVSAYDDVGNESPPSTATYDTPRPEGTSYMRDFNAYPSSAGFDFFNTSPYGLRTSWTDVDADIYVEYVPGDNAWFINVTYPDVNIQDMGYTSSFDEISYAPSDGWSRAGWVEAIVGHTYVIWTADYHYAKIRITSIDDVTSTVYFDWGYQTSDGALGNAELKPAVLTKPQHDQATYLRRSIPR